ncbi:uncharacterized protein BJ171DRAFT_218674 [Polychytrium aggregatum]|uniref:uncharacterized protein n=1 Tax=Polychytrium aggregatum TaxID=110093 RepID=UPI0022FE4A0D|nr:uncharacterized protein BJ171DRAFT_218674 [Polychytrium aggregatum]KAI9199231.1 hypothetical protein BJ171DRAFT_218674 [Polychytrium aggregatum]
MTPRHPKQTAAGAYHDDSEYDARRSRDATSDSLQDTTAGSQADASDRLEASRAIQQTHTPMHTPQHTPVNIPPRDARSQHGTKVKKYVCDFKTTNIELYRWHTTYLKVEEQVRLAEARSSEGYHAISNNTIIIDNFLELLAERRRARGDVPADIDPNQDFFADLNTPSEVGLLRNRKGELVFQCPAAFAVRTRLKRHVTTMDPKNSAYHVDPTQYFCSGMKMHEGEQNPSAATSVAAASEPPVTPGPSDRQHRSDKSEHPSKRPRIRTQPTSDEASFLCSWPSCSFATPNAQLLESHLIEAHHIPVPFADPSKSGPSSFAFTEKAEGFNSYNTIKQPGKFVVVPHQLPFPSTSTEIGYFLREMCRKMIIHKLQLQLRPNMEPAIVPSSEFMGQIDLGLNEMDFTGLGAAFETWAAKDFAQFSNRIIAEFREKEGLRHGLIRLRSAPGDNSPKSLQRKSGTALGSGGSKLEIIESSQMDTNMNGGGVISKMDHISRPEPFQMTLPIHNISEPVAPAADPVTPMGISVPPQLRSSTPMSYNRNTPPFRPMHPYGPHIYPTAVYHGPNPTRAPPNNMGPVFTGQPPLQKSMGPHSGGADPQLLPSMNAPTNPQQVPMQHEATSWYSATSANPQRLPTAQVAPYSQVRPKSAALQPPSNTPFYQQLPPQASTPQLPFSRDIQTIEEQSKSPMSFFQQPMISQQFAGSGGVANNDHDAPSAPVSARPEVFGGSNPIYRRSSIPNFANTPPPQVAYDSYDTTRSATPQFPTVSTVGMPSPNVFNGAVPPSMPSSLDPNAAGPSGKPEADSTNSILNMGWEMNH